MLLFAKLIFETKISTYRTVMICEVWSCCTLSGKRSCVVLNCLMEKGQGFGGKMAIYDVNNKLTGLCLHSISIISNPFRSLDKQSRGGKYEKKKKNWSVRFCLLCQTNVFVLLKAVSTGKAKLNLSSANAFKMDQSKILSSGKELTHLYIY